MVGHDAYGAEVTDGVLDHDELWLPEIGAGMSFCFDVKDKYDYCESDDSKERNAGLRVLGISGSSRKSCINIGVGIGSPYNETK